MICASSPLRSAVAPLSPLWQGCYCARLTPPRKLYVRGGYAACSATGKGKREGPRIITHRPHRKTSALGQWEEDYWLASPKMKGIGA